MKKFRVTIYYSWAGYCQEDCEVENINELFKKYRNVEIVGIEEI